MGDNRDRRGFTGSCAGWYIRITTRIAHFSKSPLPLIGDAYFYVRHACASNF